VIGASQARWSRHSHELFYLSFDGRIVSVPVRTEPSLDVGASATLFTPKGRWPWTDFDVAPDGKRFLAVVPQLSANEQPLTVILNWPSTIGRSTQ